jgi:glycosyltransferase involved in cell wall biosynthesis
VRTADGFGARSEPRAGYAGGVKSPDPRLALTTGDGPAARRILALIPAHDEAPRIGPVVAGAGEHLPVLVVDDGSGDDTEGAARTAGATVLVQRPNQGKGAALRTGFRWAIAHGFDAVVTLDADGQHDPSEIPRFMEADRAAPVDLVIGARDFTSMPPVRRLSNTLGGRAFSWAVGRRIPDNQSGYRLIGRRLLPLLLDSDESGFEFEVEMITTCIRAGLVVAWVPISTIYGGAPSHVQPVRHLTNFVRVVRKARRTVRDPLP